jgi:hypothetical protein
LRSFGWQDGYGAFSVTTSQFEIVREYIRNQMAHHRKRTVAEEYVVFLRANNVETNENIYGDLRRPRRAPKTIFIRLPWAFAHG